VKKMIVLVVVFAVMAMPVLAHAGGMHVHGSRAQGRFIVQGPFYWHPFFYPGPFSYGYPGGLNYAYPGPFVSAGGDESYTYGYPGPFSYGTLEYSRPKCLAKPDGFWVCS
jgi:hypothetical protein